MWTQEEVPESPRDCSTTRLGRVILGEVGPHDGLVCAGLGGGVGQVGAPDREDVDSSDN
jgi:hypothetical protein